MESTVHKEQNVRQLQPHNLTAVAEPGQNCAFLCSGCAVDSLDSLSGSGVVLAIAGMRHNHFPQFHHANTQ